MFLTHVHVLTHTTIHQSILSLFSLVSFRKLDLLDLLLPCDLFRLMKYANSILDSKLRGEPPFDT